MSISSRRNGQIQIVAKYVGKIYFIEKLHFAWGSEDFTDTMCKNTLVFQHRSASMFKNPLVFAHLNRKIDKNISVFAES